MSKIGFVGHGAIGVRVSNRSRPLPPTRVMDWPSSRSGGFTSRTAASPPPTVRVSVAASRSVGWASVK